MQTSWIWSIRERRWNEADARRVLSAWRKSGSSLPDFAHAHGVKVGRLDWWQRRLTDESVADAGESKLRFVPALISGTEARVVVRFPGGVTVEASDSAALPARWIASVLKELAGG